MSQMTMTFFFILSFEIFETEKFLSYGVTVSHRLSEQFLCSALFQIGTDSLVTLVKMKSVLGMSGILTVRSLACMLYQ